MTGQPPPQTSIREPSQRPQTRRMTSDPYQAIWWLDYCTNPQDFFSPYNNNQTFGDLISKMSMLQLESNDTRPVILAKPSRLWRNRESNEQEHPESLECLPRILYALNHALAAFEQKLGSASFSPNNIEMLLNEAVRAAVQGHVEMLNWSDHPGTVPEFLKRAVLQLRSNRESRLEVRVLIGDVTREKMDGLEFGLEYQTIVPLDVVLVVNRGSEQRLQEIPFGGLKWEYPSSMEEDLIGST